MRSIGGSREAGGASADSCHLPLRAAPPRSPEQQPVTIRAPPSARARPHPRPRSRFFRARPSHPSVPRGRLDGGSPRRSNRDEREPRPSPRAARRAQGYLPTRRDASWGPIGRYERGARVRASLAEQTIRPPSRAREGRYPCALGSRATLTRAPTPAFSLLASNPALRPGSPRATRWPARPGSARRASRRTAPRPPRSRATRRRCHRRGTWPRRSRR